MHMHLTDEMIQLLQEATNNTRGQHTARGRRRAMARALDKLSNKMPPPSLEEHD